MIAFFGFRIVGWRRIILSVEYQNQRSKTRWQFPSCGLSLWGKAVTPKILWIQMTCRNWEEVRDHRRSFLYIVLLVCIQEGWNQVEWGRYTKNPQDRSRPSSSSLGITVLIRECVRCTMSSLVFYLFEPGDYNSDDGSNIFLMSTQNLKSASRKRKSGKRPSFLISLTGCLVLTRLLLYCNPILADIVIKYSLLTTNWVCIETYQ